jgi:hypothetical protein
MAGWRLPGGRGAAGSRRVLLAIAAVVVGAGSLAVAGITPDVAGAAVASFDPAASTALGPSSAFGQVVAGGGGRFHAIARTDFLGAQRIAYRRSVDGGRTWVVGRYFEGQNGGATRPWIAAHGDDVAIGFIGSWCDPAPPGLCGEAPYLTTSIDGGNTWTPVKRLARQAFEIRVAVDRGRVWVAWEEGSGVQLRGTVDGAQTWFASRVTQGRRPQIAARDGVMVLALEGINSPRGPVVPIATVADGETVGPYVPLSGDPITFGGWDSVVAAADGRVHVLLRDPDDPDPAAPHRLMVASAGRDGVFSDPVPIGPIGYSASIAATRGTVAVAVGARDGVTSVATSANGGQSFTAPIPVSMTPGGEPIVELGAAVSDPGRPIVRFDWSVPDRYRDEGADGRPDPANVSGDPSLDGLRVFAGRTLDVHLDGCASVPASGRTINVYSWYVDGAFHDAGSCTTDIQLADGASASVRLTAEDDQGVQASITQDVAPRDFVVVSIGDSVASGEGSPHTPASGGTAATWQDDPCHRSAHAGPALAARQLEESDPRSSVTFIQLACSGAAILDTAAVPGTDPPADDPDTGGLLDEYQGVRPAAGSLRPSQLAQLADLTGSRDVDALMVSIGANDIRFSDVVKGCLIEASCDSSTVQTTFDARLAELPGRYAQLAAALDGMGVASNRVLLSEYFDPTTADAGLPDMRCTLNSTALASFASWTTYDLIAALVDAADAGGVLDDDEAIWARDHVIAGLNAAGASAASAHGWTRVGGIASQFERHGYCATDHKVVRIGESLTGQHNPDGAFHPNVAGQQVYGAALFGPLRGRLTLPTVTGGPAPVVGAASLGDLAVVTATRTTVSTVAVRSTGGLPLPGVVRQLDRLVSGDGFVGPGGPPAVDRSAAVGTWIELSGYGSFTTQALVAQLGLHPNVAVDSVRVVQAPAEGTKVVAARDSFVLATVDAAVEAPVSVDITTTVSAIDDATGDEQMLFLPVTEAVELQPGPNHLLLPTDQPFRSAAGTTVQAVVTATDPLGATADDAWDNEARAEGPHAVASVASREVNVAYGRLDLGPATVGCPTVGTLASSQVSFAGAAMPVADGNMGASLFCQPIPAHAHSEAGVIELLIDLDEQARYAALDAVVAVVPAGWLSSATGGAVGVSAAGLRAVVLEAGSPDHTLAHELTHSLGQPGHTPGTEVFGARVDRDELREGIDWMFWRTPPQVWTGGPTWDALFDLLGGPQDGPVPLVLDENGYWVRGSVRSAPGSPPELGPGPSLPDGSSPSRPLPPGAVDLSRLTATPVDGTDGALGPAEPIALAPAEGLYGAEVASEPGPIGWSFAQRIVAPPGTAAISFELDGVTVATEALTAAPVVTVTAPTAGVEVGRGTPLTITWTIDDPDSADHTTSILVSDDGGATWRPLASGLTGTTATLPLPADVGGTQVRVRVVVSDGTEVGMADSPDFSAEPAGGTDRLVFSDGHYYDGRHLLTMNPDGSDQQTIPLPELGDRCDSLYGCAVRYMEPEWSPDGSRVYFISNLYRNQDVNTVGEPWWPNEWHIWSVRPDGTELRRESSPPGDDTFWTEPVLQGVENCVSVSPDDQHMSWLAWSRLLVADRAGGAWVGARQLTNDAQTFPSSAVLANGTYPPPADPEVQIGPWDGCPVWSPDSTELATRVQLQYWTTGGADGSQRVYFRDMAIAVFHTDGSPPEIVSPSGGYVHDVTHSQWWTVANTYSGVDWAPDGSLLVAIDRLEREGFGWQQFFELNRLDLGSGALTQLAAPFELLNGANQSLKPRLGPHGEIYGTRPPTSDSTLCGWWILDAATGVPDQFTSGTGDCWDEFDWAIVGGGSTAPRLVVEPGTAPDDPNAPVPPVDATEPTPPSPDGAPGADVPSVALPEALDLAVTIPAGVTTSVPLPTVDGTLAPFDLVELPPTDQLTVTTAGPTPGALQTGLDGVVGLTPADGFVGTTTFRFVVAGAASPVATATVTVVGPGAPDAVDDQLTLPAGVETVLDPTVLLANDIATPTAPLAPLAAIDLEIVTVYGSTSGRAWLDADGMLHVLPAEAGSSTFTYVVADGAGATDAASALVLATGTTASDPTVPTTPPPTPTTAGTPGSTPTAPGVDPAAPGAGSSGGRGGARPAVGAGGLAATGAPDDALLLFGVGLVVIGFALRRARPRSTRQRHRSG